MTLKDDLIKEHKNDKILKYGITRSAWTYVKLKNPNLPRKKLWGQRFKSRKYKLCCSRGSANWSAKRSVKGAHVCKYLSMVATIVEIGTEVKYEMERKIEFSKGAAVKTEMERKKECRRSVKWAHDRAQKRVQHRSGIENWNGVQNRVYIEGAHTRVQKECIKGAEVKTERECKYEMSYPRSTRCFSPDKIPGVSIIVTHLSTGLLRVEPWNRFKKAPPNLDKGRNCLLLSTAKALPGITCSTSPYITALKLSVVGSGPIRNPGYSFSNRYLSRSK